MTLRTTLVLLTALVGAVPLPAQRATEGFQPGDVIRLEVEGDSLFTGNFTVGPGPSLRLPVIGDIPLAGVRRTEVEPHLRQQLARYLKDPMVHAKALIRLSIVGEVARPGIYPVPTDLVIADALMVAGGPTVEAKFAATRIERSGERLLEGDGLQQALERGLTLDQLNLRAGDRIFVPQQARKQAQSPWQILGIVLTIPATVIGVIALTK